MESSIDREKVIKGLQIERECVSRNCDRDCGKCDLVQDRDWLLSVYNDALALLKDQEAVEPRRIDGKRNHFIKCGNCNYDLLTGYMFCPYCGKTVKWE